MFINCIPFINLKKQHFLAFCIFLVVDFYEKLADFCKWTNYNTQIKKSKSKIFKVRSEKYDLNFF